MNVAEATTEIKRRKIGDMSDDRLPGLHWGVKASFLDYISRMPDGRGSISEGARPIDGNIMVFEPAPVSVSTDGADLVLAFRGDLRFAGHGGLLFVRIADPVITVRDGAAEMTVLHPYEPDIQPRLPLVRFTLDAVTPEDGSAWVSTDVRLTAEGTELFNDVYQPGELFEPLTIHLPSGTTPRGE